VNAEDLRLAQKERAALLCAEATLTIGQIAQVVGVHRTTITRWSEEPIFQEFVLREREAIFRRDLELLTRLKRTVLRKIASMVSSAPDTWCRENSGLLRDLMKFVEPWTAADAAPTLGPSMITTELIDLDTIPLTEGESALPN